MILSFYVVNVKLSLPNTGPVAQRIRHLTTNQGIAGSSPARVKIFLSMKILSTRGTIIPPESGVLNTTYQKTKSLQPKLGVLVVPPEAPSLWHGKREKNIAPLGGLEPPASRLTAERASRLRHRGIWILDDEYRLSMDTCCCPMRVSRESKPHIEHPIRYGLVVRIPGSHPGGPGSIPGVGNPFLVFCTWHLPDSPFDGC